MWRAFRVLRGCGLPAFLLSVSTAAAQVCEDPAARVVSVQGTVEVRRDQQTDWRPVKLEEQICPGDSLRVLASGRAALALTGETVTRLDQNTTISFRKPAAASGLRHWLYVLEGVLHIITRERDALRVDTPFANAGIEGTEFLVTVTDADATVEVLEGAVRVDSPSGAQATAESSQAVRAPAGAALVVAPADRGTFRQSVRWTLYYPPVGAGADGADATIVRAREALVVGRVADARRDIQAVLAADSGNADALALRSVIALAQNDLASARQDAESAVKAQPLSAAALLALSYVRQAEFKLDEALQALQQAAAAEPGNALVQARLAELWLAVGDADQAVEAAQRAVAADERLALPRAVLGFALLARVDTAAARARFLEAIERDSAAPLPRLGLGLALIRDGKLAAGREQLEIAVLLDPDNALIRSYLGKAYYEEKRARLAGTQFGIAKDRDPPDPTPWFYDAILKQSVNRPVEALHDLQTSITKNENRAVYRSRLLLDEDLAARSASQGRVYADLGFSELALREGWRSVEIDPGEFAGHRLLADSYALLPRHERARVSELYQSQLLQPLNLTPIQPQLGEANLFILDSAGPSSVAFNEFNTLFNRNRFAVQGSAVTGGNDTWGNDAVVAGVYDRMSFSLGQFHFESDGFRENNDIDQDVLNAVVQYQLTPDTSLLAEVRSTETENGDLPLLFDPLFFVPELRQTEASDAVRLGLRHAFSPRSLVLVSAIFQSAEGGFTLPPFVTLDSDTDGLSLELQHQYRGDRWRLVSGIRHVNNETDETVQLAFPIADPPFLIESFEQNEYDPRNLNVYTYAVWDNDEDPGKRTLQVTLGGSYDDLHGQLVEETQFNPKLGVRWMPNPDTTLRLSAFRTLQEPQISRRNMEPRLEPTAVTGFNQFFFGSEGQDVWRYGLGLDQKVGSDLALGLEASTRDLEIPIQQLGAGPSDPYNEITVKEDVARLYLYWTPDERVALSAGYQYENIDNNGEVFADAFESLITRRLPFAANYFAHWGLSLGLAATYVDQEGQFPNYSPVPPFTGPGSDNFWVVDGSVSYRLPKRFGLLTVKVFNLFDEEFQFSDTDPSNPRIIPERFVVGKLTVAF